METPSFPLSELPTTASRLKLECLVVLVPACGFRDLPESNSINCDAKIWKTCCGVCLCSELRRREGRRLGNNFSQLQLLFTSNCQAVISGKDARCHLQPIFLLGIY